MFLPSYLFNVLVLLYLTLHRTLALKLNSGRGLLEPLSRHQRLYHNLEFFSESCLLRGGANVEEDGDGDGDEENDESEEIENSNDLEPSNLTQTLVEIFTRVAELLGRATTVVSQGLLRGIQAGLKASKAEGAEGSTMIAQFVDILRRMWKAALNASISEQREGATTDSPQKSPLSNLSGNKEEEEVITDFRSLLAKEFGIVEENEEGSTSPILGGSLGGALTEARSKARLLVVFIPALPRQSKSNTSSDRIAMQSLLSAQVSKVAEKKSRKSADTGSFLLWVAKAASAEAVSAAKRLKSVQPKGGKRPTLIVAYPANVVSSSGVPRIVPRVLAQHHCSPPPSPEAMAAWLAALRKRHFKLFAAMINDITEIQLFKERQEGYKSSVRDDLRRKEEEDKAELERVEKEKAVQERIAAMEERRVQLKQSLPEEADKRSRSTITVALRFADGRAGQRRFDNSAPLSTVFNWVDAMFELERERISLCTMNAKKIYSWDDIGTTTLKEAGLGRMTGFRVMEKDIAEPIDSNETREVVEAEKV